MKYTDDDTSKTRRRRARKKKQEEERERGSVVCQRGIRVGKGAKRLPDRTSQRSSGSIDPQRDHLPVTRLFYSFANLPFTFLPPSSGLSFFPPSLLFISLLFSHISSSSLKFVLALFSQYLLCFYQFIYFFTHKFILYFLIFSLFSLFSLIFSFLLLPFIFFLSVYQSAFYISRRIQTRCFSPNRSISILTTATDRISPPSDEFLTIMPYATFQSVSVKKKDLKSISDQ